MGAWWRDHWSRGCIRLRRRYRRQGQRYHWRCNRDTQQSPLPIEEIELGPLKSDCQKTHLPLTCQNASTMRVQRFTHNALIALRQAAIVSLISDFPCAIET